MEHFEYEGKQYFSEHTAPISTHLERCDTTRQVNLIPFIHNYKPEEQEKALDFVVQACGLIPHFAVQGDMEMSLVERMTANYGFGELYYQDGTFLLAEDGTYLYDHGADEPLTPYMLIIDRLHKEFCYIYSYGVVVFGTESGNIRMSRMD